MKAILISRVSTEEQKEAGLSLPAQVARLELYCQNRGFSILQSFSFDESAYSEQREDFDRILNFIATQKEKVIICCDKVDRLSRNIFDKRVSILYEKALKDEIEIHFVSDGQIITSQISAVEKFHFSMSLGLAKYYSDAISDNIKRANEQKLRKGELPGRAPYGYKNIRLPDGTKDIVIDDYGSVVVIKAYELYATGTYSMELLRNKLRIDYGVTWSQGFIDYVLKNSFYYGEITRNNKLYSHRYKPLITKALFDQVQETKAGFNKKPVKFAGLSFLYRGMFKCATCGLAITPERHKGHAYYHCTQYNGKHGAVWLREENITEQIVQILKRIQMPKEIVAKVVITLNDMHQQKMEFQNAQMDAITRERKTLTTMMDNLYLDKLKVSITSSAYDKFYTSFREQLEDLNSRLARLEEAENNYYVTAKYALALTNQAYDLFISSEVEEKRQLIKFLLSNLKIDSEKLVCDVRKPFDSIAEIGDQQVWCAR